ACRRDGRPGSEPRGGARLRDAGPGECERGGPARRAGRARRGRRREEALSRGHPRGRHVIRLGRISYANMAPVFYRLVADAQEITGVPTELNRLLLDGEVAIARVSALE